MARTVLETAGEDVIVGGNVDVIGTDAPDEQVTVISGNITLDASFTNGGDTIVLPGLASQYSAVIVGSRLVLTGPGVTVSIPLSPNANTLVFDGGDSRDLSINGQGQVELGDQVIPFGTTATQIEAGLDANLQFTTGEDHLVGTAGDDTFNAPLGLGIDGLVGVQSLQGVDSAVGNGGMDTLNAELNSTGTTQNPTLQGIQVYNLTSFGTLVGPGGNATLNLARSSGYEQLWNRDSTGSLTLLNVGEAAAIGLDHVQGGTTYTINYDNIAIGEQTVIAMNNGVSPAGLGPVNLQINGVTGQLGDLNLDVSGGNILNLQGAAASPTNLDIDGSGLLTLTSVTNFTGLVMLDASGYNGSPLILDISGSGVVEDVLTGDGDDRITMASALFSAALAPTSVDLGGGYNTLVLFDSVGTPFFSGGGANEDGEIDELDFTLAPVENVQVLNLQEVSFGGNASLALDGVGGLEVLQLDDLSAGSNDLLITGGPETLTIQGTGDVGDTANLDFDHADLTVQDTADLTLETSGDFVAWLYGDSLVNVDLDSGEDADIHMEDAALLETLNVNGDDSAYVDLNDTDGDDADGAGLESLDTVNVTSGGNATLYMTGASGVTPIAGVQEVWQFTVSGASANESGSVVFSSQDLPGGSVLAGYSTPGFALSYNNNAAGDLAAALAGASGDYTVTGPAPIFGTTFQVTWNDTGDQDNPSIPAQVVTTGNGITVTPTVVTEGVDEVLMVPGTGFASLMHASVVAGDDALVDLQDVYGDFDLNVIAGGMADIDLYNTEVNAVTVTTGTSSTIDIGGDTVGARSLESLDVSGRTTDIDLNDDLGSLRLIDVSGVTRDVVIDSSDADFDVGPGDYVDYHIGYTTDSTVGDDDVFIIANEDNAEVFTFVGSNIGYVRLGDDTVSNGAFEHDDAGGQPIDRIDLSALGFTSAGQLQFDVDGNGDLVITDIAGGPSFSGQIVIDIDGNFSNADVNDFASNNIIFA